MTNLSHDKVSLERSAGRAIADAGLLHLVSDGERLRSQGYQAGLVAGLTQALLFLYQHNLGTPPVAVQQSLNATQDASRLIELLPVFLSSDAEAIARAVLL